MTPVVAAKAPLASTASPLASTASFSSSIMFLQHMGCVKGLAKCFPDQSPLLFAGCSKQRPSRVQSLVSSQGSMDSDHLGESAGAGVTDGMQPDTSSDSSAGVRGDCMPGLGRPLRTELVSGSGLPEPAVPR